MFQSTRPRGARHRHDAATLAAILFQSTRPRGARPPPAPSKMLYLVSIHAPTWGATIESGVMTSISCFNPRAHVGRDHAAGIRNSIRRFQSTRPRGARRITKSIVILNMPFQSTRPRGARLPPVVPAYAVPVSIHAPTWGAT